jgi:acyl carrier protein
MTDALEIQIRESLRQALGDVLDSAPPELAGDTRLFADLALDSTNVIELLMSLEDTLGLEIDPDELKPEAFETVGTLSEYIRMCLAAGSR